MAHQCSIFVLNWNGSKWLKECLPSVVAAAERSGATVVVVDNQSTDDSLDLCRQLFPSVRLFSATANKVLASYNEAVAADDCRYALFLNNDLAVTVDFLQPLLGAMETSETMFAVCPKIKSYPPNADSPTEAEAEIPKWHSGMIRGAYISPQTKSPTFYTCGGAMLCRRDRFLELGGFDDLYLPGYHEDVDLSWRAWKRGWPSCYIPDSVVFHAGGASMGKSLRIQIVQRRNAFLFHWKNLQPSALLLHVFLLPLRLALSLARRDFLTARGFVAALKRLPDVVRRRWKSRPRDAYGDFEIVNRFRE